MISKIIAWLAGTIFALGVGVAGMTQPSKVVGFLDLFGHWDPSLLIVMAGAISVHFLAYKWMRRRAHPFFSPQWHVPYKREINPILLLGGFIFGVGWGLGGYCPGPSMTSLMSFEWRPLVFVLSMLIGMFIYKKIDSKVKFGTLFLKK